MRVSEKPAVEEFDWIVVGSGAGSFASALVMREAGKSVLILEKGDVLGGTTAKSGGVMWIPANSFMMADGEDDTVEKGATYLDAIQELEPAPAPGTSPQKRMAYLTNGPRAVDFLVEQGVKLRRGPKNWPDYYDELPGGCKTSRTVVAEPFNLKELGPWRTKLRKSFAEFNVLLADAMEAGHMRTSPNAKKIVLKIVGRTIRDKFLGRKFTTAGAALQGRMLKAAVDAGTDIRLESPVKQVLVEDGRATGVVAWVNGGEQRFKARLGVLVNAGGFAKNQTMRDQYMPGTRADWSLVPEWDTGDMHRELEQHGAQLAQMDQMVGYQTTHSPGSLGEYVTPGAQSLTGKPHAILVDQSGQRYMNEGGSYELYCENMLKRNREVPAVPSWAIMDRTYVEKYQVAGKFIDKKIPKGWVEEGYLHTADSIQGLARSIGLPPAVLDETVARWNGFVAAGEDKDFGRGNRKYDNCGFVGDPFSSDSPLGEIAKAPFYAVPVVPGDVSTYGGVVTDEYGRVVKEDGSPIDGLYATGVTTASVMGNAYAGAGSSIGPSMTFGYIAARHAAGLGNS